MSLDQLCPITGQDLGHVISLNQSELSILSLTNHIPPQSVSVRAMMAVTMMMIM